MTTVSGTATCQTFSALDLTSILEPVRAEMELVEQRLATNLIDDNPFVTDLLAQIFLAGGKRIRPGLVLLSSRASAPGCELGQLHIILSVLTELIHTASLVHDDVIDSASLRRGQETVNRKWNDRLAVLVGDLLFAQASICLARLMNPVIVGIYGQVLGDLCAGEIKQMKSQYDCTVDWDAYIHKSVSKTASLFSAATHSGAILNGSSNEVVAGLKEYGRCLGICFQIVDDLLDFTGTSKSLGKPAGGDLSQGVLTAPALIVLERKDHAAQQLEKLIASRQVCTPDGVAEALQLVKDNGGIDGTIALCRKFAQQGREALTIVQPSIYRDCLSTMIDYLVMRTS